MHPESETDAKKQNSKIREYCMAISIMGVRHNNAVRYARKKNELDAA